MLLLLSRRHCGTKLLHGYSITINVANTIACFKDFEWGGVLMKAFGIKNILAKNKLW